MLWDKTYSVSCHRFTNHRDTEQYNTDAQNEQRMLRPFRTLTTIPFQPTSCPPAPPPSHPQYPHQCLVRFKLLGPLLRCRHHLQGALSIVTDQLRHDGLDARLRDMLDGGGQQHRVQHPPTRGKAAQSRPRSLPRCNTSGSHFC